MDNKIIKLVKHVSRYSDINVKIPINGREWSKTIKQI